MSEFRLIPQLKISIDIPGISLNRYPIASSLFACEQSPSRSLRHSVYRDYALLQAYIWIYQRLTNFICFSVTLFSPPTLWLYNYISHFLTLCHSHSCWSKIFLPTGSLASLKGRTGSNLILIKKTFQLPLSVISLFLFKAHQNIQSKGWRGKR